MRYTPRRDGNKGMNNRFLEIYNEKVFDLLNIGNERLSIVDSGSDVLVRGLSERRVYKQSDLYSILHEGSESRRIGATEMNQQSSRSHAIFTITICRVSETSGTIRGKLHFVDLAGSERLEKTKATGSRAAEGISINKSLSTLSKVIESLSTHQSHIPYRESSLTRLLKDSLGGNAKTLMLACVSPADSNIAKTDENSRETHQKADRIQPRKSANSAAASRNSRMSLRTSPRNRGSRGERGSYSGGRWSDYDVHCWRRRRSSAGLVRIWRRCCRGERREWGSYCGRRRRRFGSCVRS